MRLGQKMKAHMMCVSLSLPLEELGSNSNVCLEVDVRGYHHEGEKMVMYHHDGSGSPGTPDEFEITEVMVTTMITNLDCESIVLKREDRPEYFADLDRIAKRVLEDYDEFLTYKAAEQLQRS